MKYDFIDDVVCNYQTETPNFIGLERFLVPQSYCSEYFKPTTLMVYIVSRATKGMREEVVDECKLPNIRF